MDDKKLRTLKKKKWDPPTIFVLSAKRTDDGGDPAQQEDHTYNPTAGS